MKIFRRKDNGEKRRYDPVTGAQVIIGIACVFTLFSSSIKSLATKIIQYSLPSTASYGAANYGNPNTGESVLIDATDIQRNRYELVERTVDTVNNDSKPYTGQSVGRSLGNVSGGLDARTDRLEDWDSYGTVQGGIGGNSYLAGEGRINAAAAGTNAEREIGISVYQKSGGKWYLSIGGSEVCVGG